MADAMVTARMPLSKKRAGNEVLSELGYSASRAINELYDRVVETRSWPLDRKEPGAVGAAELVKALAFVDGMARVDPADFEDMGFDEAKRRRLMSKGRATEGDFA